MQFREKYFMMVKPGGAEGFQVKLVSLSGGQPQVLLEGTTRIIPEIKNLILQYKYGLQEFL